MDRTKGTTPAVCWCHEFIHQGPHQFPPRRYFWSRRGSTVEHLQAEPASAEQQADVVNPQASLILVISTELRFPPSLRGPGDLQSPPDVNPRSKHRGRTRPRLVHARDGWRCRPRRGHLDLGALPGRRIGRQGSPGRRHRRTGRGCVRSPADQQGPHADAAQEAAAGRYWLDIGAGDWDSKGRPSEVRLDRALWVKATDVRREGAILPKATWQLIVDALEEHYRTHGD